MRLNAITRDLLDLYLLVKTERYTVKRLKMVFLLNISYFSFITFLMEGCFEVKSLVVKDLDLVIFAFVLVFTIEANSLWVLESYFKKTELFLRQRF
jgi:hypothetical protein